MKRIKKYKVRFLFSFLIITLLSSCYTQKDKTFLQESRSLPQYETVDYSDYRIAVNDELLFRVTSTDEDFINIINAGSSSGSQRNSITYRVYPDGTIDIPFIDSVYVVGKTLFEASQIIQKRFVQIVPDADVKLTLSNKHYTVVGDAGTGVFPVYKEKMSIYQALAQSGEIALTGDRKHVKIIREREGTPEILEFDIRPNSVINSKYYYIYPNDIIYVQRDASSFYKVNNYGSLLGLISSSISFFTTVYYITLINPNR